MTVVPIGHDPFVEMAAKMLATAEGITYEALDVEERERYRTLGVAVAAWVAEDDFHIGCASEMDVDEARDEGRETGWREGVEVGLAQAKARMLDGLGRLVGAEQVEADCAERISSRIERMGVDWDAATRADREE